jgi:methylated-DNA-[protein]-cysteine S-methyltransferase
MTRYLRFATPLGPLYATAADGALTGIYYEAGRHAPQILDGWSQDRDCPALRECARQLADYFAGKRRDFDLPLLARGTPFQQRVWQEIARIPFGATLTYAELGVRAGAPGSARAAGAATGRNPHSIVVPCHRVVGSDGRLTGYAGGMERKRHLLEIEGVRQAALP